MPKPKLPGSKKGVPKPIPRPLDPEFNARVSEALAGIGVLIEDMDVPALAEELHCSRQTVYNLLKGGKRQIDPMLLFDLADYCGVHARWLLRAEGPKINPARARSRLKVA